MKKILIFVIIFTVLLGINFTVDAVSLINGGYQYRTVDINSSNLSSSYAQAFTDAVNSWNNAGTNTVSIAVSSSSSNTIFTVYASDTYYGTYAHNSDGSDPYHNCTLFHILLNTSQIQTTISTVGRSTITHEFGHSFGLGDVTSGDSIMNVSRNRYYLYTPKTNDVLAVRESWNR